MTNLTTGVRLGPYSVVDTLGSTALSVCYLGIEAGSGRRVAIRLFRAYFRQQEEAVRAYLDELEGLRTIPPHPGILLPLTWDWTPDGLLWVASEFAEEPSLAASPPPQGDCTAAARIVTGLAAALDHVLASGFTHRDLKPANVFWDAGSGVVRLGDFGIATLVERVDPLMRTSLSTPAPPFMAPEYAGGGLSDARSEVFSLAVIAYWLLTGAVPFPAGSREALYARAMAGNPPPPSSVQAGIPASVDRVLQRALAPFPPVRPGSPGAFAAALKSAVEEAGSGLPAASGVADVDRVRAAPGPPTGLFPPAGQRDRNLPPPEVLDRLWSPPRPVTRRERLVRAGLVVAAVAAAVAVFAAVNRPPEALPPSTSLSTTVTPGNWTVPRYDLGNSAFVPVSTRSIRGRLRWRFETSAPFLSSPAASGGVVYVSTGDRRVVALDQATGALKWEAPTTGPVDASPVIAGDLVYVGLRDSRVLALDRTTGAVRWDFRTGNPIVSGGVVDRGFLYQGSGDGNLYAIDAATGDKLWHFSTGAWVVSPPALTDEAVVVIARDGWVHFLDRDTGLRRFVFSTVAGGVNTAPALSGGLVHYAGGNSRIFAVDAQERSSFLDREIYWFRVWLYLWQSGPHPGPPKGLAWSAQVRGRDFSSAAVDDERVFVGAANRLVAVERGSGEIAWTLETGGSVAGAPVASNDTVYAGSEDGKVYAADARTGEQLWAFQTGGKVRAAPALVGDLLLVTSEDGVLYALE